MLRSSPLLPPGVFVDDRSTKGFVASFYSSLTRLSCEMEGHPLGGGMLKLEPTEAERLLVAMPVPGDTSRLVSEVDGLLRSGSVEAARDLVDAKVLRKRFGLSATECAQLRDAAAFLESWRGH